LAIKVALKEARSAYLVEELNLNMKIAIHVFFVECIVNHIPGIYHSAPFPPSIYGSNEIIPRPTKPGLAVIVGWL
jgi:hypothetical protein